MYHLVCKRSDLCGVGTAVEGCFDYSRAWSGEPSEDTGTSVAHILRTAFDTPVCHLRDVVLCGGGRDIAYAHSVGEEIFPCDISGCERDRSPFCKRCRAGADNQFVLILRSIDRSGIALHDIDFHLCAVLDTVVFGCGCDDCAALGNAFQVHARLLSDPAQKLDMPVSHPFDRPVRVCGEGFTPPVGPSQFEIARYRTCFTHFQFHVRGSEKQFDFGDILPLPGLDLPRPASAMDLSFGRFQGQAVDGIAPYVEVGRRILAEIHPVCDLVTCFRIVGVGADRLDEGAARGEVSDA